MTKKFNILLTGLFCAFLGGVFLLSVLLPKKEFSELENRYLAQTPEFSLESLKNGDFMADAEDYTADHIVGRDFWVSLKSWSERLSGKQENNGVYFAADGALINRVDDLDWTKANKDMAALNTLAGNLTVPVHFGLIPSAAAVWQDKLPAGAPTADELGTIETLYFKTGANTIDMAGALLAHKDEAIYYRTDHHWTSLGAFYGANAIFSALGLEELNRSDYTPVTMTEDFNGTIFSSSGVRWVKPDSMQTFVPEEGVDVTCYFSGRPEAGELYVEENLGTKDKYSFFLGGNQPLCVLKSQAEGPRVLVVRDSYADSLAPFLTERFSEVHLFDLRYNINSIPRYVEENGIDQVIVLYSFNNFATDKNLFLLGR